MRLNEGSIQISSQMLAKSLKEVPILVLGLIFIEITRGPLCVQRSWKGGLRSLLRLNML